MGGKSFEQDGHREPLIPALLKFRLPLAAERWAIDKTLPKEPWRVARRTIPDYIAYRAEPFPTPATHDQAPDRWDVLSPRLFGYLLFV
jgi:hypothetical protein